MGHVQPAERRQGRRRVLLYRLDQGVNELSAAPEWRGRAAVVFLIAFPTADPSRSPLPSPVPLCKYSHEFFFESARVPAKSLPIRLLVTFRTLAWTAKSRARVLVDSRVRYLVAGIGINPKVT